MAAYDDSMQQQGDLKQLPLTANPCHLHPSWGTVAKEWRREAEDLVARKSETSTGDSPQERAAAFLDSVRADDGTPFEIIVRPEDDYVNATALCKSSGRLLADYCRTAGNQRFLRRLGVSLGMRLDDESSMENPILVNEPAADARQLIKKEMDRPNGERATWVHPRVAIHVAGWCSAELDVAMNDVLHRYMTGKVTTEESMAVAHRLRPFLLERVYLWPHEVGNLNYMLQICEPRHTDLRYTHSGMPVESLESKVLIKFGVTAGVDKATWGVNRFRQHRKAYGPINILDVFRVGNHVGVERAKKTAFHNMGVLCSGKLPGRADIGRDTELIVIDKSQAAYADIASRVAEIVMARRDDLTLHDEKEIALLRNRAMEHQRAMQREKYEMEIKVYREQAEVDTERAIRLSRNETDQELRRMSAARERTMADYETTMEMFKAFGQVPPGWLPYTAKRAKRS